jgi:hypothetical protein
MDITTILGYVTQIVEGYTAFEAGKAVALPAFAFKVTLPNPIGAVSIAIPSINLTKSV